MKKQTAIIQTLARRSFQNNRGRNLVAVLAIVLTTMMFTALFTLAQSMRQNMTEMYLRQAGTMAHTTTKEITDDQIERIASHRDVAHYGRSIVVALAENKSLAGRQVEIRYASDQYAMDDFAYPTTGHMPQGKNEVALDTLTLERLGIPLELGQTVTLEWRRDLNAPEVTSSTFTLCGWWEGNLSVYASMAWVSEEFALEACDGSLAPEAGQICGIRMMSVTFADSKNIDDKTTALLADCGLSDTVEFSTNLAYQQETQHTIFMENLPMYGGMLLVFLAGYLIIFNVFQISVAADIQFFGRLKTLGATKKQIKKLIYGQGNRLSLLGIPVGLIAGYLLGIVLVPALITVSDLKPSTSANPIIFIGSAIFTYITVVTSCTLPARVAGSVSPMEALRYTDASGSVKKKQKKTKHGASLSGMAWANLWRNRKRTVVVICSLTLGFVLMSFFYAKNASFDVEKYLMDLTVADYEIDDATNDQTSGYNPASQTISDGLLFDLAHMGGVETTGRLYSQQADMALSKHAQNNLQNFYTEERLDEFASYDPSYPDWKDTFDLAMAGQTIPLTIYGADGLILEAATSNGYILNGTYHADQFETGEYCLAIGPAIERGSVAPTYSVGETVKIKGRDFTVMAVLTPLQPMVGGVNPAFDLPLILPADAFLELWPSSNLRKFYFDVADDKLEQAESLLLEYQQSASLGMNIVSRQTMVQQYEAETRASSVMGYAISIIIALVGILNFINSMVTAIISRRREFAMIQSIGMTKRQLQRMLMLEGLYYAGLTLIASYLLGTVTVGVIVRGMVADGFSTFHFTLFPLLVCTPILLFVAALIPLLCFKNLEKQSIVERLRSAE